MTCRKKNWYRSKKYEYEYKYEGNVTVKLNFKEKANLKSIIKEILRLKIAKRNSV